MPDNVNTPGGAQVDFITTKGTSLDFPASVAHRLLSTGFNVNVLRTCDVLRKDEWILGKLSSVEDGYSAYVGSSRLKIGTDGCSEEILGLK